MNMLGGTQTLASGVLNEILVRLQVSPQEHGPAENDARTVFAFGGGSFRGWFSIKGPI